MLVSLGLVVLYCETSSVQDICNTLGNILLAASKSAVFFCLYGPHSSTHPLPRDNVKIQSLCETSGELIDVVIPRPIPSSAHSDGIGKVQLLDFFRDSFIFFICQVS